MKTIAIILSGGRGTRFGSAMPKQYIEVCGKPVLAYTLSAFQESCVDEIVIVAAAEYMELCRQIAADYGITRLTAVTEGGTERYDSVFNGLRYVINADKKADLGIKSYDKTDNKVAEPVDGFDDETAPDEEAADSIRRNPDAASMVVLIHDGARPFISSAAIDEIIKKTTEEGACIASAHCTDTIKIADEQDLIVSTTNRRLTWAAQTPQAFYLDDIYNAYEQLIGNGNLIKSGINITDDAMVYQLAYPQRRVKLYDAGKDNFKITSPSDIILAEMILNSRVDNRL